MELKENSLRRFRKKVIKEVRGHTIVILLTGDLVAFTGFTLIIKDLILKNNLIGSLATTVIGVGVMIVAIEIGMSNESK